MVLALDSVLYVILAQSQGVIVLNVASDSEGLAANQILVVHFELLNAAQASTTRHDVRVQARSLLASS